VRTTSTGDDRRRAEKIAGGYALGQEVLGHAKKHVAHVVAEVLGAVAALKDTRSCPRSEDKAIYSWLICM
jgi:hypothetical protein